MATEIRLPVEMTEDQFFEFCQINRDLQVERTAQGDIVIMSPVGGRSGNRNSEFTRQLGNWAVRDGRGAAFDSSGGFVLPNGATRSPDASWLLKSRIAGLTNEQKDRFLPLCPDFVVEIRSPSDALSGVREKMREYMENGARLGWLIDPMEEKVYVYRPGKRVECLRAPAMLKGDPELPGFVLDLDPIWEPVL